MTILRCRHCGAETTNGLALCETCQYAASMWLTFVPIYFRNLARQQRPGRPNGSLSSSGQWMMRRGEIDSSLIPKAMGEAVNDVVGWARSLADDRGVEIPSADTEAETVAVACALLSDHLTSIATLEWAGEFLRRLGKHERALRDLTETAVPGWYAGACRQVTGRSMEGDVFTCGTSTYVVPGLTWVTCTGCGTTTAARDHLEAVLEEAGDWLAPPMRIAEALVALVDGELSVPRLYERIKKWGQRGQIQEIRTSRTVRDYEWDEPTDSVVLVDREQLGPARLRFGEALDTLLAEGATRLGSASGVKAG